MNFYAVTLSPQTVKRDGNGRNIMSLVYPGSANISIVLALSLQEVGRLTYTARKCAGCLYGIHCLFHIIFCSLEYYYFYHVYIVIVSY